MPFGEIDVLASSVFRTPINSVWRLPPLPSGSPLVVSSNYLQEHLTVALTNFGDAVGIRLRAFLCHLSGGEFSESRQLSDLENCNSLAGRKQAWERAVHSFSAGLFILVRCERPRGQGALDDLGLHGQHHFSMLLICSALS